MDGAYRQADCNYWFGIKLTDLDCAHWLPYLDAAHLGMKSDRKLTIQRGKKYGCADTRKEG